MRAARLFLLVFLAMVMGAGNVFSGDSNPGVWEEVDGNADQAVTPEEFFVTIETIAFGILDKNGDGRIEMSEWKLVEKGGEAMVVFSRTDADGDGFIVYEEMIGVPGKRVTVDNLFSTMDKNQDGRLEKAELKK